MAVPTPPSPPTPLLLAEGKPSWGRVVRKTHSCKGFGEPKGKCSAESYICKVFLWPPVAPWRPLVAHRRASSCRGAVLGACGAEETYLQRCGEAKGKTSAEYAHLRRFSCDRRCALSCRGAVLGACSAEQTYLQRCGEAKGKRSAEYTHLRGFSCDRRWLLGVRW